MHIRGLAVVTLVALITASCGRETPPPPPAPGTVEVRDAVFVLNPDGSATLSAKVINTTKDSYQLSYVPYASTKGNELDDIRVRFFDPRTVYPPEKAGTIGDLGDKTQIRLAPAPAPGTRVTLTLGFGLTEEEQPEDELLAELNVTVDVPVVTRTPTFDSVLGAQANTAITIEDGKIFVIPGQRKAYLDGKVISDIHDCAYEIPTKAVADDGRRVDYQHQTATGGPYGICTEPGKVATIGYPPYTEGEGDADYFDAKDLTIGEKITVTIPFESGDVEGVFTVVRG
ncbi:hypothetical protein GCM10022234_09590 [Aeromicrobium panaciterrae]|uniref:hypothetical protein n=1 Tax=Aeromicrobium panaciterrae TaxID=363861 RepID=UPI0031D10CD2